MTPIQLCKAIDQVMNWLPNQLQADLKRVYAKTWSVVELHREGLITPPKHAKARLEDLWRVVDADRNRLVAESEKRAAEFHSTSVEE